MHHFALEKTGLVHQHKWDLYFKFPRIYIYCTECGMRVKYPPHRLWLCYLLVWFAIPTVGPVLYWTMTIYLAEWFGIVSLLIFPLLIYAICIRIAYAFIKKTCTEEKLNRIMNG